MKVSRLFRPKFGIQAFIGLNVMKIADNADDIVGHYTRKSTQWTNPAEEADRMPILKRKVTGNGS